MSESEGIDRTTLYQIEKGNPLVSMGEDKQGGDIQDLELLGGKENGNK